MSPGKVSLAADDAQSIGRGPPWEAGRGGVQRLNRQRMDYPRGGLCLPMITLLPRISFEASTRSPGSAAKVSVKLTALLKLAASRPAKTAVSGTPQSERSGSTTSD